MKEKREKDLRMNLAELDQSQLITTAVKLQGVIDEHIAEKTGFTGQISQLGKQNAMLQEENDRLEAEAGGEGIRIGIVEFEALQDENKRLRERNEKLAALNEKLQEKMLGG